MKKEEIKKEEDREGRVFMRPGRNNIEDRLNFVKFWADYIKTHNDEEWSKQQNILIDSQIKEVKSLVKK